MAHVRADALHKATTGLAQRYATIAAQDLNVAGMTRNRRLARAVADQGFGAAARMLAYKTTWNGGRLILAGRWYPSSKTCSGCGAVKAKLALSERTYRCPSCGLVLGRDVNAARNLLHLAVSGTESINACRAQVRPGHAGPRAKPRPGRKQEPGTAPAGKTGTAGVIVPPPGYLAKVRELCTSHGALMIADEIQSGLARTGPTFACEHDNVVPDVYLLGKALGGGIMPLSAVVSTREVLGVFKPGQHGSTFGGNPLACAIGREVIAMLSTGEFQERSAKLGVRLHDRLSALPREVVREVRGRGLWAGVEFTSLGGREVCERLAARGVLAKDTYGTTVRLAPPLVIREDDLDWALDQIESTIS